MKVILSQDVPTLGKVGDLVKVSDGYARNFLLPRKLAMIATAGKEKEAKHIKSVADAKKKKAVAQAQKVAEKINNLTVQLKSQAGENDKLFGSITSADIAVELTKAGYSIEKRDIHIEEPIRALGQHKVTVRIASGVDALLKVNVERG